MTWFQNKLPVGFEHDQGLEVTTMQHTTGVSLVLHTFHVTDIVSTDASNISSKMVFNNKFVSR